MVILSSPFPRGFLLKELRGSFVLGSGEAAGARRAISPESDTSLTQEENWEGQCSHLRIQKQCHLYPDRVCFSFNDALSANTKKCGRKQPRSLLYVIACDDQRHFAPGTRGQRWNWETADSRAVIIGLAALSFLSGG